MPRFHLTWGAGKALVDAIWAAIEGHPRRAALEPRLRTRVTELLADEGGRVTGIRVEGGHEVAAGAVVVAAGGVDGNLELSSSPGRGSWAVRPATC